MTENKEVLAGVDYCPRAELWKARSHFSLGCNQDDVFKVVFAPDIHMLSFFCFCFFVSLRLAPVSVRCVERESIQ